MKKRIRHVIYHSSIFKFPSFQSGILSVWSRNFYYFRKTWFSSILWILIEPLFYLLAVGFGVGAFVHGVNDLPYLEFFFSGLIVTTAMMVSFFESTYGNFAKLSHQKVYATILLSPLGANEIALGEIFWGATKGFISSVGVIFVASLWGITNHWMIFACLPVIFMISWIFSCFGMIVTTYAKSYDSFVYAISGFIVPMALFCGTYFPLEQFPVFVKWITYAFPITHAVIVVRTFLYYTPDWWLVLHLGILLVFALGLMNLAVERLNRKILN